MADAPSPATVSLSRSRVTETPRHLACGQDSAETPGATADLRALARLVLARDTRRDGNRDKVSRPGARDRAIMLDDCRTLLLGLVPARESCAWRLPVLAELALALRQETYRRT
jgi:hypothetical protein